MSWAVVYTKKNSTDKDTYLEKYAYSKENAEKLVEEYNKRSTDKEYRVKYCETLY
jgi:hypothetical protein